MYVWRVKHKQQKVNTTGSPAFHNPPRVHSQQHISAAGARFYLRPLFPRRLPEARQNRVRAWSIQNIRSAWNGTNTRLTEDWNKSRNVRTPEKYWNTLVDAGRNKNCVHAQLSRCPSRAPSQVLASVPRLAGFP
eukprot:16452350-Heterocapsa_arctica.AAC.2